MWPVKVAARQRTDLPLDALEMALALRKVRRHGPWRSLEHLELATLEWVDWFNHRRLNSWCGNIPPAEYEAAYYTRLRDSANPAGSQ